MSSVSPSAAAEAFAFTADFTAWVAAVAVAAAARRNRVTVTVVTLPPPEVLTPCGSSTDIAGASVEEIQSRQVTRALEQDKARRRRKS